MDLIRIRRHWVVLGWLGLCGMVGLGGACGGDTTVVCATTPDGDVATSGDTTDGEVAETATGTTAPGDTGVGDVDETLGTETAAEVTVAPETTTEVVDETAVEVAETTAEATEETTAEATEETIEEAGVETPQETLDETVDETLAETEAEITDETVAEIAEEVTPDPLPPLIVNEVECRGAPSDWVEVVNLGDAPVSLVGLTLSDDVTKLDHRAPLGAADAFLAPGDRIVVAIAAFGISCGNEPIVLLRDEELVDTAPATANPVQTTWGRLPDLTGAWQPTASTPGAPNSEVVPVAPPDPGAMMFDPTRPVPTIDLTIGDYPMNSLRQNPYLYVPATFTITEPAVAPDAPATVSGPFDIGTRVKGKLGSLAPIDGKAGLKISFDHFSPGGTFRGLSKFDLNNFQQDGTHVHELLAYRIFRAMGVPAPRTGYAWVRVNGQDKGLYLVLEAREGTWLDRNLPDNVAIFEGEYGQDLFVGIGYSLQQDRGPSSARLTLEQLTETIESAPQGAGFMTALASQIDWDEVLAAMATEVFIGHWDGYAPTRNNYYFAVDASGVWRLLPWGTDQTFGSGLGWYDGQGILLQRCMADPVCKSAWEGVLFDLSVLVTGPDFRAPLAAVPGIIQPYNNQDGGADAQAGLDQGYDFLTARATDFNNSYVCIRDYAANDLDHDGYACNDDCNENDPDTHVGAQDICGDGIDQDCNGPADDAPECPDCAFLSTAGGTYSLCSRNRTYADARSLCESMGQHLWYAGSDIEQAVVLDAVRARGWGGAVWLGLTDLVTEGKFIWDDGSKLTYVQWSGGEPNDWGGGEDCAQVYTGQNTSNWNDIDCNAGMQVICEL